MSKVIDGTLVVPMSTKRNLRGSVLTVASSLAASLVNVELLGIAHHDALKTHPVT